MGVSTDGSPDPTAAPPWEIGPRDRTQLAFPVLGRQASDGAASCQETVRRSLEGRKEDLAAAATEVSLAVAMRAQRATDKTQPIPGC